MLASKDELQSMTFRPRMGVKLEVTNDPKGCGGIATVGLLICIAACEFIDHWVPYPIEQTATRQGVPQAQPRTQRSTPSLEVIYVRCEIPAAFAAVLRGKVNPTTTERASLLFGATGTARVQIEALHYVFDPWPEYSLLSRISIVLRYILDLCVQGYNRPNILYSARY